MRYLRLFIHMTTVAVQRDLAFRANLIFQALLTIMVVVSGVLALRVVYGFTQQLAGWTYAEALILLGMYGIVSGIADAYISPNLSWFAAKLQDGTFDETLTKPIPSLLFASLGSCSPWPLASSALGLVLVMYGIMQRPFLPGIAQMAASLFLLGVGLCIAWSTRVLLASIAFWSPGFEPSVFYSTFWQLGRYPLTIYPQALRMALTYVLPLAFVAMFPTMALTRASSPGLVLGGICGASAAVGGTIVAWRLGVRQYTSATS